MTEWLYLLAKSAKKEITLQPKIKKRLKKEWKRRSIARDAMHTPYTKKQSKDYASLVQLVEHRSPKPSVGGSSPSGRGLSLKRVKMPNKEEKLNFKDSASLYFKGIKAEWGKISWPQRQQIIGETIIVFIVVAMFTAMVFLMDIAFKWGLSLIPK